MFGKQPGRIVYMGKGRIILMIHLALIAAIVSLTTKSFAQNEKPSNIKFKYIGCSHSQIFHREKCLFAKLINPKNKVIFLYRNQAITSGYRPCKYCLPPVVLSTHCRILLNNQQPQNQ